MQLLVNWHRLFHPITIRYNFYCLFSNQANFGKYVCKISVIGKLAKTRPISQVENLNSVLAARKTFLYLRWFSHQRLTAVTGDGVVRDCKGMHRFTTVTQRQRNNFYNNKKNFNLITN